MFKFCCGCCFQGSYKPVEDADWVEFEVYNEVEQSLASAIADRATDEVVEALTRYRRGLGVNDSPLVSYEDSNTPDVLRSRSSQNFKDSMGLMSLENRGLDLPKLGLDSPTKLEYLNLATPHLPSKRRSMTKKCRPQSVVGLGIENLSLSHIPDLLESPVSQRTSKMDGNDSITELPSASLQLQHLVKGRPKRAKTRAPTRPLIDPPYHSGVGDGIEHFFRPGSVTPTTLTPLVSPTSEECSSLSFVDSPTMSRDENGRFSNMTSGETTPILDERKVVKLDRSSPLMKGVSPWTPRSRSHDNLEKCSPVTSRRSPLVKNHTTDAGLMSGHDEERLLPPNNHEDPRLKSPSNESIKSHDHKTGNGIILKPNLLTQKQRPWSMAGSNNEPKNDYSPDSNKTTPDGMDNDVDVVPIAGQAPGGSIVGICPGIALTTGGGSIVGITPGAALERKSVRDLAAGLNRIGVEPIKSKPIHAPKPIPRSTQMSTVIKIEGTTTATSTTLTTSTVDSNQSDLNNNSDIKPKGQDEAAESLNRDSMPVRKIAGKKISALFEETLVEGLQRSSFRHSVLKEGQFTKDDTVDV